MTYEFIRETAYTEKERRKFLRELLAREFIALSEQTRDPVIKRFAEKALTIIEMKDRMETQDEKSTPDQSRGIHRMQFDNVDGTDASGGVIGGKQFGIFLAIEREAEEQFEDPNTRFILNKGDFYIELHIPPVNPDDRVISQVRPSLELLANYLDEEKLNPKCIMGITYERLASVSEKWGFTVVDPNLPPEVSGIVETFNRHAVREGLKDQSMVPLKLAYQDGTAFLQRFSPNRSPSK